MNPFVNPKQRSVALPNGCKDLMDVLQQTEHTPDTAVRRFINLVLFQAHQDRATELVICAAPARGGTPMRSKVDGIWYDLAPFPSHIRPGVIVELARMAKFPAGQFPNEGVLDLTFGEVRLRWVVGMTSADAECKLARVQD